MTTIYTTIYMVYGRMSANYGQPEFVVAPTIDAQRIASAPASAMIARFGAQKAGRPFVVDGFVFSPYTSDMAIEPEIMPAYQQAGISQKI